MWCAYQLETRLQRLQPNDRFSKIPLMIGSSSARTKTLLEKRESLLPQKTFGAFTLGFHVDAKSQSTMEFVATFWSKKAKTTTIDSVGLFYTRTQEIRITIT